MPRAVGGDRGDDRADDRNGGIPYGDADAYAVATRERERRQRRHERRGLTGWHLAISPEEQARRARCSRRDPH